MQLGILLAIVATILISENAPAEPVAAAAIPVFATWVSGLSVILFATWGSVTLSRAIRADAGDRQAWFRWFGYLQRWHLVLWLASIAVSVYLLHWPRIVRYNCGLDRVPLLKDLLVLAPVWFPLLCSWAAFYEVEAAVHHRLTARSRAYGHQPSSPPGRWQFVWLQARHYLGLCLPPILILLMFQDGITLMVPGWRESRFGWLLYLVPIIGVTLTLPQLLSRIWPTTSLPPCSLRDRLRTLTRQLGVRTRDFRVWQTKQQMLNAAVSGLVPAWRYVFITDGLLNVLRAEEIESVMAHELGHIQRRHLWLRLLLLSLPIWIMGNVRVLAPELGHQCSDWLVAIFSNQFIVNSAIIPALAMAYAAVALGRYSRILEHDADLCVHDLGKTEAFCATLDRLSYLASDHRRRSTWLHPSTVSRIHLLQRALRDPAVADTFRRRLHGFNLALVSLWAFTPMVIILLS